MSNRGAYTTNDYNVVTKGRLPEVHRFEHLADVARKRGEADMVLANSNIRREYTKRLKQTRQMKDHMERIQRDLRSEMSHCEHARQEVLMSLKGFEPILCLSKQWSDIRKGRPTSPSPHYESIDRAAVQYNDEVKVYMEKLVGVLRELDASMAQMRELDLFLDNDINAKVSTMIIDNACMEELISPQDLMGAESALPIHNAIMQSTKLHTENEWANNATAVLSSTNHQIILSQKHRKKAVGMCRSLRESGKYQRSPTVLDAFAGRIKYNAQHCHSLEANMSMVNGQIDALDRQQAMMVGSLDKVLQQLGNAKQRLNVRALLPDKENTRPEVEMTLEIEMSNLRQSEMQLRDKLEELERKRDKQIRLLTQMKDEVRSRSAAIASDKHCMDLKLPTESSMANMMGSASSNRSDSECGSTRSSRRSQVSNNNNYDTSPRLPSISSPRAPAGGLSGGSGRSSGRYYQQQQQQQPLPPQQYQQYDQGASDDGASSSRSSVRSYSSSRASSERSVDTKAKPTVNGKKRLEDALAAVAAAGPPILKSSARVPKPPQNNKGR